MLKIVSAKVIITCPGRNFVTLKIETSDGITAWITVGVGHNIVEASWEALRDSVTYGLRRATRAPSG